METFKRSLTLGALAVALSTNGTEPVVNTVGICFTENKGQVCDQKNDPRPDVLFSGISKGMVYHLTQKGISYQLNRIDNWKETLDIKTSTKLKTPGQTTIYRVDVNWIGADPNSGIIKGAELPGSDNYYLAQCPNGILNVKKYKDVIYKNIYKDIDLKWYEKNGELEYDFILKPNADPKQIKIEIKGAEKLSINANGELEIKTPLGTILEQAPVAFQNNKLIKTQWKLNGSILGFKISNYDVELPLVIDPAVRMWGTYYGGSFDDIGKSVATDITGNVYMGGSTISSGTLLATSGSHQTTHGGGTNDAFLVKFNSNGVRQWATYYGSTGDDNGNSIAVETSASPNIYLAGQSDSPSGIATAGGHQPTLGGAEDLFLAKFNASGVLQWATYYGDGSTDDLASCAIDGANNVLLAGTSYASSTSALATVGSHQVSNVAFDGVLVKFDPMGTRLWATYYGGASIEYIFSVCTNVTDNSIYIAGRTSGATGTVIATTGSHQSAFGGGSGYDAFLVKFNSSGVRQWGTYYGSSSHDIGTACRCDNSGNVYLAGYTATNSGTIIATSTGFQPTYGGGGYDGFLAKFNSSGVRQWGTYIGNTASDYTNNCKIDNASNVLITGETASSLNIGTAGSHQSNYSGSPGNDAYLMKFNTNGVRIYGTYYGGAGKQDYSYDLAPDLSSTGNVYIVGRTNTTATAAIATTGAHQQTHGGGTYDAFIVKFAECNVPVTVAGTNTICSGSSTTLTVSGATTYSWNTGATTNTIVVTPSSTTTYTATGISGTCYGTNTITVTVETLTLNAGASSDTLCAGDTLTLIASGAGSYYWSTGDFTPTSTLVPTSSAVYTVDGYGVVCIDSKTISITVNPLPSVTLISSSSVICTSSTGGGTISLSGSPSGGIYSGTSVSGPSFNAPATSGTYIAVYTYTDMATGCKNSSSDTITVNVCTGMEELSLNGQINIYPNPNNGEFILMVPEQGTYSIINSIGQAVQSIEVKEDQKTINVSVFANGIYYVIGKTCKAKIVITK